MKKPKVKPTFICISCSDLIKDFWNPKWGWNRRVMPEFGESKDRYLCYECYKKISGDTRYQ